jgi:MraZ protein
MLFLGRHEYSIDDRGRIPVPPRYRDGLMRGVILTPGTPDKCIRAFATEDFEKNAAPYMDAPLTTENGRMMRRNFFSNAEPASLDKQGRVLIPQELRDHASLDRHVVILGVAESFEIWNPADLAAAEEKEAPEFIQTLGQSLESHE